MDSAFAVGELWFGHRSWELICLLLFTANTQVYNILSEEINH